ncbi:hypothetical protein JB92DRAFT_2788433 [Gautieria morchelliformis]|nr:hypothetical protein JB92DRAFT_2788433 [Gautieria morchelliformis]
MLTLQHFILKQRALSLYRSAIRASRSIPGPVARRETIMWIRAEFEYTRNIQDIDILKGLSSIKP